MEQYLELLKTIKQKGTYKPAAREGMPGTQSYFGYQFRHDLSTGFPLLTTKKMFWKGVVVELLWFLRGDTNIKYLVDNGVNIWNEDAYNYYLKTHKKIIERLPVNDPFVLLCKNPSSFDEFVDYIKNHNYEELVTFEKYTNYRYGDCGFQYGKVWRDWEKLTHYDNDADPQNYIKTGVDQIKNVVTALSKNPESRRHLVSAIDPAHENDLALYWCHALFQFNCRPMTLDQRIKHYWTVIEPVADQRPIDKDFLDRNNVPKYYLDCQLYQRSADVFLGVPFNIASYALLTEILAKMSNMIAGEFIHTFGDVHIYDNHKEAVDEQLTRTPSALPRLTFNDGEPLIDILKLDNVNLWYPDMFKIENYNPQKTIKAELSTGLVK